ncbi:MAG: PAS domain S-box protein [Pyrinomonadaceae bacterium]
MIVPKLGMPIEPDENNGGDMKQQLRAVNEKLLMSAVVQHELIEQLEIAQKALSFLGLVVASSKESIITVDFDGIITTWNKTAEDLYGYPAAEAVGRPLTMLTLPEDLREVFSNIEKVKHGELVEVFETIRVRKGGDEIDLEILMSPVTAADGRVIGAATIARDITERVSERAELEARRLADKEGKADELKASRKNETRLAESQMRLAMELSATQKLQEVSTAMIGVDDPNALYEIILDAALQIMRAQYASIQQFFPERGEAGELWLLGYRGYTPEAAKFWEWISPSSKSNCGAALRTCERAMIANVEADLAMSGTADLAMCLQTGIRALQATPLISRGGKLLGMLSTHWNRPHNPSERDLRLFDVLARQAADLMERTYAEDALRETKDHYRALFDLAPMALFVCNRDAVIQNYNQRAAELWGREPECGVERHCGSTKLWLPDGTCLPHDQSPMMEVLRTGIPAQNVEVFIERPDGSRLPVLVNFAAVKDAHGEIIGAITSFIDITERRRTEQGLIDLNAEVERQSLLFDTTINSITDFAYTFDCDGRFVFVNRPLLNLWGLTLKEAVGKDFFDLGYPDDLAARLQSEIQQVIDTKKSVTGETPYTNPAGAEGFYEYIFSAVLAKDGTVEYVAGSTRDITDRKAAEQSIRFQAHLLDTVEQSAIATDLEGIVIYWNRFAEKLYGWTAAEAIGQNILELTTPDIMNKQGEAIMSHLRHGKSWSGEFNVKRRDGAVFPAHVMNSPIENEFGELTGIVGISVDITERKRVEEALRLSRQELETRVVERTAELAVVNETLKAENKERLRVEEERVRILHRLVTAQEDERRRIGRDLHDQLGQQVTALRLKLEAVAIAADGNEEFTEHVKKAQEYAKQVDADVGFLTFELRPTILDDLGLVAAVENYVYEWSLNHKVPADFHAAPVVPSRFSSEIEINLYRLVQEALNNVVKYAGAKNVTVQLDFRHSNLILIVEDDGAGFIVKNGKAAHHTGNGLGLIGMRERCMLLGGTLEIESAPGKGTVIFARIPMSSETSPPQP